MIFSRRSLQHRLNELRSTLASDAVDNLAARLNRAGRDSMAAMWEVVILHGLIKYGMLANEVALISGRRPDVKFESSAISFTADITCVSDEGLDEANPYRELSQEIETAKTKLGMPIGGVDLRVQGHREPVKGGVRTSLRLPPRKRIRDFVRDEIIPQLREQMAAGATVYRVMIDDGDIGISLSIDASRGHYSTGSYTAYNGPASLTKNPLWNALSKKAVQLRSAHGMKGIIVGNGGSHILDDMRQKHGEISAGDIAKELLRQYTSIDFILYLTISEAKQNIMQIRPGHRSVQPLLVVRDDNIQPLSLETLFRNMLTELPTPHLMPVNAALRAREDDYDLGHHGGYRMQGNKIRIGSRELTEILAGIRTIQDDGAKYVGIRPTRDRRPNMIEASVLRQLTAGRLPKTITVIKTDTDDDDDWIEIEFGDPDPAISPLK